MSRLADEVPEPVRGHLEHCLTQALAAGAPEPARVEAAADAGWVERATGLARVERAGSVVAVADQAALVTALRLGFGGALWLPPATSAMRTALAAAAAARPLAEASVDPAAIAELGVGGEELLAVAWRNRAFWQVQLGERVLAGLLGELARHLGVRPVILPWPALLLGGGDVAEIETAVTAVVDECALAPTQGVEIVAVDPGRLAMGAAAAVLTMLAEHEGCQPGEVTVAPNPVYRLVVGEPVGWWSPCPHSQPLARGWLATPGATRDVGHLWQVWSRDGAVGEIADVLVGDDIPAEAALAVRVPGWAVRTLDPGSPNALLVERLGRQANERGVPLWVPNVCKEGVRQLLRLGLDLWVDGPCVPCPDPDP
jgi:hypothetical protein